MVVDGKRLIMACSNNYLGLANDPRVMEAASQAALRYAVRAMSLSVIVLSFLGIRRVDRAERKAKVVPR